MNRFLNEPNRMWVCTDHDRLNPVPVASVVMANSEEDARYLLEIALQEEGLDRNRPFTLLELNISIPFARVLSNGDY